MASLRKGIELSKYYGAFSHDVTAAILVFQNKKVSRTHISVRQGEIWVRDYQNNQTAILLQPHSPGFSLLPWCPKQILWARVCGCFTSYSTMKQKWLFELSSSKNEKSKDYCKADTEQRVLFFYNNISAGHPASFFSEPVAPTLSSLSLHHVKHTDKNNSPTEITTADVTSCS